MSRKEILGHVMGLENDLLIVLQKAQKAAITIQQLKQEFYKAPSDPTEDTTELLALLKQTQSVYDEVDSLCKSITSNVTQHMAKKKT